jgi:hypothetical protein
MGTATVKNAGTSTGSRLAKLPQALQFGKVAVPVAEDRAGSAVRSRPQALLERVCNGRPYLWSSRLAHCLE